MLFLAMSKADPSMGSISSGYMGPISGGHPPLRHLTAEPHTRWRRAPLQGRFPKTPPWSGRSGGGDPSGTRTGVHGSEFSGARGVVPPVGFRQIPIISDRGSLDYAQSYGQKYTIITISNYKPCAIWTCSELQTNGFGGSAGDIFCGLCPKSLRCPTHLGSLQQHERPLWIGGSTKQSKSRTG